MKITQTGQDLNEWRQMVAKIKSPKETVKIALVGKYVELRDAYISVREALNHAALYHDRNVEIIWVNSEELEHGDVDQELRSASGIVVPGGFGDRGIEGKIMAAKYARENKIPYLGLCLGMHMMVIDLARHVLNFDKANSTEFDQQCAYPVIDLLPEQRDVDKMGGTMRLGIYPCNLVKNTLAQKAYGTELVHERHRHRFEFNNDFREQLEKVGFVASGISPDGRLVEIGEIKDHPWMVGVQFHPEFLSRPGRPHPLFRDFIGAAKTILREGDQPSLLLNDNIDKNKSL
jgi:CTP synthase